MRNPLIKTKRKTQGTTNVYADSRPDVPRVMHANGPANIMALGLVSNEEDIMRPKFFQRGLRDNAAMSTCWRVL